MQQFNSLTRSTLVIPDDAEISVEIAGKTDGYDGHCLRAYNYFPEVYVGVPNTVEAINATEHTHPKPRQDSKAPTFALTYLGTYMTLMRNCGFSEQQAKAIEANYHTLYKVSDEYVEAQIAQAGMQGYIEVAFGLRIRTSILHRVVMGTNVTPRIADAEKRTLGNAIGQSWGLLNNRSAVAFMKKVYASEHRDSIYCISMIHDATYFLIKDDVDVIKFVNDNLIKEMQWQEHPKIQHDQVKLGGKLEVCYGGWHQPVSYPNNASYDEILTIHADAKLRHGV